MSENYLLVDAEGNATEVSGDIKIGRNKTNELVISDPLASRHHATVYKDGETLMIRDEGSSNGTYVNGEQIYEPTSLSDQDKIQFGDEEYTVRAPLWDSATIRAPQEGEEPVVEEAVVSKKAPEMSSGPRELAGETVISEMPVEEVDAPPAKNSNRTILIIALAVVFLCFCCIVIAGILVFVNRNGSSLMDSGVLGQIQFLVSQTLV